LGLPDLARTFDMTSRVEWHIAYPLLLTFTVVWMAIGPLRALMLIVASLIFYAAAGPFDMLVFLGAVALNWLIQAKWKPAFWA